MRTRRRAALIATIFVFLFTVLTVEAATPTVGITAHDLAQLDLVIDPRDAQEAAALSGISQEKASELARDSLNRVDQPWQVLHGRASRIAEEPSRAVWIVVFLGGDPPPGGPMGVSTAPVTVDYTGSVIDDQTGEILRSFGKGH